MKKKLYLISSTIFVVILCFALCFGFVGCGETLDSLQNDYGAVLDGGGFEKGSSLVTDIVDAMGDTGKEIVALLENQEYNKDGEVSIFDIFVAKDGNEVQPNGKVKITLPAPFESENGYVTFHVKDDDSVEKLETTYAEGKISFETESFSYFVVASATNSAEAKKYTFTATLEGEGSGTIYRMNLPHSDRYQTTVKEGTEITLKVEANGGFAFVGWYIVSERGDAFVSADAEYTFTVNADMTAYARIERTFSFDAMVSAGGGRLEVGGEDFGQTFRGDYVSGDTVTLKAIGDENYEFEGWYTDDETPVLISTDAEYTFTIVDNAIVFARFRGKVVSLWLDATSAGFTDGQATYSIGGANRPAPEDVLVYGVRMGDNVLQTQDADYTIDFGGLDFTQKGTYVITYTYKEDPSIKATLTVAVTAQTYTINVHTSSVYGTIYYNGTASVTHEVTVEVGTEVTFKAVPNAGYEFLRWETVENLPQKISGDAEYTFTANSDFEMYAAFQTAVTELVLSNLTESNFAVDVAGAPAVTEYVLGSGSKPNPYMVHVTGVTTDGNRDLTVDVDYIVNWGGYDMPAPQLGEYTITYTYIKNPEITATLTLKVVEQKYTLTVNQQGSGGGVMMGEYQISFPYAQDISKGESITLTAVTRGEEYVFAGWFEPDETGSTTLVLKDTPVCTQLTYTFYMPENAYTVYAVFEAIVTGLILDGANAGFTEGVAAYTIGDENRPNPDTVVVKGVTAVENVYLTKDVDYTIDLGGLDFNTADTYTITYTYSKNTAINATLKVIVAAAEETTYNLSYTGLTEDSGEYNGGRALYVFKSSFTNNGVACDIEDLGLSYEWRDHTTKEVVEAARDDTWDSSAEHYPSPAVVGTYDFVVYKLEDGNKVDLFTLVRTIEVNKFELDDGSSGLSEYTNYTFIAKVGSDYYALPNLYTLSGNIEREAIKIIPDENGIFSLGENYECVFRPYDSGKATTNGLVYYGCRTGNGLNRIGSLILWESGGVEYTTSTVADYTITITFNEDGTVNVHSPYCGGTLRLVYEETTGKYLFTANENDTRTAYPVYLYKEYEEVVVPNETFEFYNKLDKVYDGEAVSFNAYKDVYICTADGDDLFALLKMETGRFVWTDLKFNVISVGTVDEEGNVTGPSDVGQYQLVFQTLEKGEEGMEWVEKAVLHTFEITDSSEVN